MLQLINVIQPTFMGNIQPTLVFAKFIAAPNLVTKAVYYDYTNAQKQANTHMTKRAAVPLTNSTPSPYPSSFFPYPPLALLSVVSKYTLIFLPITELIMHTTQVRGMHSVAIYINYRR